MRIAYHSVSPLVKSGYGRCTAELAYRLADDFEVDIYAYYGLLRSVIEIDLNGPHGPRKVRVIGNLQQDLWHHVLEKRAREYDLVITHSDSWAMPEKVRRAGGRWVAWVIGDHDPVPWGLRRFIEAENVVKVVPMTHWFKRVLEKARDVPKRKIADPIYHGIDLSFWHPVDECPIELPRGTEFFIVTVAANYGPRENIPIMLEAYAIFLKENDVNAYYYVHAEPVREFGFNLIHVCEQLEEIYEVRLAGRVGFKMMDWEYPDEFMRALYSAADVHLLVPLGGSFEIPILEAAACGTPSITSEFSGPGELVGYGERGLCVPAKVPVWMNRTSSRQFAVDPRDIAEALRIYLENPELRRQHAEKMRKWIEENATWDKVASQWYELIISLRR